MKKLLYFISLILVMCNYIVVGQNNTPKFSYSYTTISLDSTVSKAENILMKNKIDSLQKQLAGKMNVVIGQSTTVLTSFFPASPLSNLLTDMLFQYGNTFCQQYDSKQADMSLLNFGGIRNSIPKGDVTIGDIYKVLPFDNANVVIIELKGSELTKVFQRFTDKKNQPYSQLQIRYHNGIPFTILLNNEKIDDDRIYRLVTINFIESGGDHILSGITFEKVIRTNALLRDVIINEIKSYTSSGKKLEFIDDERVTIDIQYNK